MVSQIAPIDHVRAHPEMYLMSDRPDGASLAARLAGDALLLGAGKTLVVHDDRWWAVAADVDWLSTSASGLPLAELFARIIPLPEAGVNSMRSEVLIGAFAEQIVTWGENDPKRVMKGSEVESGRLASSVADSIWKRVVAFAVEPAASKPAPSPVLATARG
jgi:hypothetical protein